MASLWEPVNGVFWSSAPLLPSIEWLTNLGNSSFFTTVFGALAGAFAGAWAAQRIAVRNKLRDELRKELRNTNAGIMLAIATANIAIGIKRQPVRELKKSYDADRERFRTHLSAGLNPETFACAPKLSNFPEVLAPVDALQEVVLGGLSTTGRELSAVVQVTAAYGNLNNAMAKYNELIDRVKDGNLPEGATVLHLYLGLPYGDGISNRQFGGYIPAIAKYTDDAIFYSVKLIEDLQAHGAFYAEQHRKEFGGEAPSIGGIDPARADKDGLIPKDDEYASWIAGFKPMPVKKRRWWRRG
jgi:hypothetical protein